jgi:hypothetical protein
MDAKLAFAGEFAPRLKAWQAKVADLESRADRVTEQNQIEFYRQLDLLDAKIELAQRKLALLKNTDNWNDIKASLDGISNEIENALDSAWAKIN